MPSHPAPHGDAPCGKLRCSGPSGKPCSSAFAWAFTRPGHRRFAEWVTALALNVEEHTITQSVLAIERPADWKALESFAEYGAWRADSVTRSLTRLIEKAPGRIWHGYHVSAVDDTKVHRNSPHVWGTCTFHEYTARCPNRATTVRAHNWVVLGALLQNPGQARLVPADLRAALLPQVAVARPARAAGPHRAVPDQVRAGRRTAPGAGPDRRRAVTWRVFDGGFALQSVVRPLVVARGRLAPHRVPDPAAARRPAVRPAADGAPQGQRGPKPKWGQRLPPPRQGGRWTGRVARRGPPSSTAGGGRSAGRRWSACGGCSGHEVPVKAVVAEVEGYKKRFTLVTSAVELTGLQMVELFAARFRQEDGFRDLKQRLGWEECRAWTRNPIERTSQAQWVTMSLLRLSAVPAGGGRGGGLVVPAAVEPGRRTGRACWTWSGCCGGIGRKSSNFCRIGWEMRGKRREGGMPVMNA